MKRGKNILSWLYKVLWSRLGRNIIFWAFLEGFWWYNVPLPKTYSPGWYILFRSVFGFLMLFLSYFNNLLLVPKLLVRKKYLWYILSVMSFLFVMSFATALTFNIMMHQFPQMEIGQVSFITTDVPVSYNIHAMIDGAWNYYFFFFTWLCMFNMAWYMAEFARQQNIVEQSKKKQMESELAFLKGQMNPHFLFNNLNNLYGLALRKAEQTPDAILKLSSILRYLLYESDIEKISFEREKEIMEACIDLELLRLPDIKNLHFSIAADGPYELPPLLWLPVLENVFKYATRVITDHYFIEYHFEISDNRLTIYSKNNYKPVNNFSPGKSKNGGIGLENLKKRLALLYPGKYSIHTGADDLYYITEVKINLA